MEKWCLIGGGNLAHTCIGYLSTNKDIEINLLTERPSKWSHNILIYTPENRILQGHINQISSNPEDVIRSANVVFICLPAFCVEKAILQIKPFLNQDTIVGTVVANNGFFLFCHKYLPTTTKLFGFQRVPYVSRIIDYGFSANLLGYRDRLYMATENILDSCAFRSHIERLFGEETCLVDSYLEVTLSNSNPILHTGRLYTMWKNWDGALFDRCSLFYKEWTVETSELEIKMDNEFFLLLSKLNVNTNNIESLLTHYESTDAQGMTNKIRSIDSLSTIQSPMKPLQNGWIPDFTSRYFTEDFPFGLRFIRDLSKENGLKAPYVEKVYEWGITRMTQQIK